MFKVFSRAKKVAGLKLCRLLAFPCPFIVQNQTVGGEETLEAKGRIRSGFKIAGWVIKASVLSLTVHNEHHGSLHGL